MREVAREESAALRYWKMADPIDTDQLFLIQQRAERRSPSARVAKNLATAALVFTSFFASPAGTGFVSERVVAVDPDARMSEGGMCELSPQSREQLTEDCKLLPHITDGAQFVVRETPEGAIGFAEAIGTISENDVSIDQLPPEFQTAYENAMQDPLIRYTLKKFPVTLYQSTGKYAEDNAFFDASENQVGFEFNVTTETSDLYKTYGSIRSVWLHEAFGHGVFDSWYDQADDNPQTKEALLRLGSLCRQDLDVVNKSYLKKHGKTLEAKLDRIRELFADQSDKVVPPEARTHILKAIATMDNSLEDPNKFAALSVITDEYNRCKPSSPLDTLTELSGWIDFIGHLGKVDKTGLLNTLDTEYRAHIRSEYLVLNESHALKGLTDAGGHAYDNTTERVASTVAIVQINPIDYVNNLQNLPLERQKINLKFIETLYAQIQHTLPTQADQTNFPYVIYGLQQNIKNAE